MTERGFRHVPLVDRSGRPTGIVAMRDIVRWLVSMFPDSAQNLPPDPRKIPTEYGG
jgi:CBS domain-containing protein